LEVDARGLTRRAHKLEAAQAALAFPPPAASAGSPAVVSFDIEDSCVIIGSDAHYWPGEPSTAHKAFVRLISDLQPQVVIYNGDVFDGATCSRHTAIGWEHRPEVAEELDACQRRLLEVEAVAGKAELVWTMGNHDMRFETHLAQLVPEYKNVSGIHLKDHFPHWTPAWRVDFGNLLVVQHRWRSGHGAGRNNALLSGRSFVTGHDHVLQVTPWTDLNGTRYGVQSGTLAVPYGPQFINYTEASPVNWRSGFVVLTFRGGRLLEPELVSVINERKQLTQFRGEITQEV
jgi:Calcineurin-like phosphoesterase